MHGTFSFQGKEYKLRHCAERRVTVCLIPQKNIIVFWEVKKLARFQSKIIPLSTFDFLKIYPFDFHGTE